MTEISVIVAIYNADGYLSKCLNSIKLQTFRDFEVLMVDDGSTDNSLSVCEQYAKEDARFKYFHKENGGVASARNFGLKRVTGKYVIHADADDWMEPTMLEDLYNEAERQQTDMLICDFYEEYVEGKVCRTNKQEQRPETYQNSSVIYQLYRW